MIKKFYFPLHFDGDNRGCEGIAKGTAILLDRTASDLISLCRNVDLDNRLGVGNYVTLQPTVVQNIRDKVERKLEQFLFRPNLIDLHFKYMYRHFLNQISKDDCMISTGGDMLCYGNNMVNTTNNILSKRGVKTILWGCSMGEKNYTPEKYDTLKRFNLIYARESLSYEYFKSLNLQNVVCLPDPAFILEPEKVQLPECFKNNDVIGINISPFVMGGYGMTSPFAKDVQDLIKYILKKSDSHILLVPHVLWSQQDDRIVCENLMHLFNDNQRISVLDSSKYNYLQIRYVISNCRFFIGGRTHSVISAYSTGVPSIAIGYSVKAIGIAKDLGLSPLMVVDSKDESVRHSLIDSYVYLLENEEELRLHLQSLMPQYKEKVYKIRNIIMDF